MHPEDRTAKFAMSSLQTVQVMWQLAYFRQVTTAKSSRTYPSG